jgi:hypothetical protein
MLNPPAPGARRFGGRGPWLDLACALLAALLPALASLHGSPGPLSVTLNVGPNDAAYLEGFHPHYEGAGAIATRWSTTRAGVRLPFAVSGRAALVTRAARVLPQTADVTVAFAGQVVDRYAARGGRFDVRRVDLPLGHGLPATVAFDIAPRAGAADVGPASGGPTRGLSVDWLRLELGVYGRLHATGAAAWRPAALAALLFVLWRVVGFGRRAALGLALPFAVALAAAGWFQPLVQAHVLRLLLPGVALAGALAAAWLRRRPGGRWVLVIVVAGYLVKGAGLFHPDFFYPDVQLFRRYVNAFSEAQGSLAERGVAAQEQTNTAYPRFVAGRPYAFPYSPVFFLPFLLLPRDAALIEDAQRHVALLAVSAEGLLVFWLAGLLFRRRARDTPDEAARTGLLAALVSVLLPIHYSRLLLAMWPTLVGHVFDLLAIGVLARWTLTSTAVRAQGRRFARLVLAVQAALLMYVSSLINLGALLAALAWLERRRRGVWLLRAWGLAALVTVLALYGPFVQLAWTEMLPAITGQSPALALPADAPRPTPPITGLGPALGRVLLFYGLGWPLLAVAGFVAARREARARTWRLLVAWAAAFALLLALRAFGFGLFKDLKELTFVAPLVALTAGLTLARLVHTRLALMILLLLMGAWTAQSYASYWNDARAPVMIPLETSGVR